MGFTDLTTDAGLAGKFLLPGYPRAIANSRSMTDLSQIAALESWVLTRSYIEGYAISSRCRFLPFHLAR